MKKIECFETEDGKLFKTYADALILNASIITGDLMKKNVGENKLCNNPIDAQIFKKFLVSYMTEVMLKDFTAFKSLFDGGLSCK